MTAINLQMFGTPKAVYQSSNINQLTPDRVNIAYQVNDSLLAGMGVSLIYSLNNTVALNYGITSNQSAKTLADVSAKIYANQSPKFTGNQSGEYFLGQSAKHFANLKHGEFTPFAKGDFSHLSKVGKSRYLNSFISKNGKIEFCESIKGKIIEFCQSIKKGSYLATQFCQFFGSMPRLSSSLRRSRLIQPALLSSPSSIMALVKRSDKSASKRSCTTILSFWFSLVDIGVHPYILNLLNGNVHHCIPLSKAMPRSGGTLTGHLITTDSIIIEVTMSKHNTPVTGRTSLTPNQSYRWLFLALNRSDYTAKPCRIAVTAPNENSARLMLVRDYMLIFAGRLPTQEVAHA